MTKTIDLHLGFEPHAAQMTVYQSPARFKVLDCGRRFGKTQGVLWPMAETALLKGQPVAYCAPKYKTMDEVWEFHKAFFAPVRESKDETLHSMRLINGVSIDYWTLEDENACTGRKYGLIAVDEAAQVANLLHIWNQSLRPTLTDFKGGAFFQSTPRGRNGFWSLHQRGLKENRAKYKNWESWTYPTSANPFIDPEEIEEARRDMPDIMFRQEYLAEFLSDENAVFRHVWELAKVEPVEDPASIYDPTHLYTFGVDYARTGDFSVIDVFDVTAKQEVYLDRSHEVPYELQKGRLRALSEIFRPTVIYAEDNAMGAPIIESLFLEGMPIMAFHTSNVTKALLVDSLALAFERKAIQILNDPVRIGELQAYEMSRTPSGMIKYGSSEGNYDDTVMGLMLAHYAAQEQVMGEAGYYRF